MRKVILLKGKNCDKRCNFMEQISEGMAKFDFLVLLGGGSSIKCSFR
jgi:hypothetical protein